MLIQHLERPRWNAIYNYLIQGKTAKNIVGEVVSGIPLDRDEVEFVENKLHQKGVYL